MTSLFAGNLHPDCTEATLYRKFSAIGKILNIHLFRKTGSPGYAYINFAEKKCAEIALQSMNYDVVKGQPIRLMWAKTGMVNFNPEANLFLKNLHKDIDEKVLFDIFANYGTIVSLKIRTDKFGKSLGIGYLQYEEEKSADAAIKAYHNKLLKGLSVTVCKFQSRSKRTMDFNNLYLKNLPEDFDDKELNQLCQRFGTILSAKVMKDDDGLSRGFGFVCFKDTDSAKKAAGELNNTMFFGKKMYVGRAKTKTEREAELLENFWRKLQLTKS